jgi:hypothetical protein
MKRVLIAILLSAFALPAQGKSLDDLVFLCASPKGVRLAAPDWIAEPDAMSQLAFLVHYKGDKSTSQIRCCGAWNGNEKRLLDHIFWRRIYRDVRLLSRYFGTSFQQNARWKHSTSKCNLFHESYLQTCWRPWPKDMEQ